MACKLDVDIVVKQVIEREIKNISFIENNFANTTIKFNKKDIELIVKLNKQWGEKVITYNSPIDNDVPGNITIFISEKLYDKYIKAIDKKRNVENTEKIREELRKDAERAGVEYTDDYLFQKQTQSQEGIIASEKTIRDLAARMSDRIGMNYRFISDRSQEFKGRITKNLGGWSGLNMNSSNIAEINLAYATLDTPIHEILGHPIIRAIKNKIGSTVNINEPGKPFQLGKIGQGLGLYNNLLKELETGKGKEVLDRIKRDYKYKFSKFSIGGYGSYTLNPSDKAVSFLPNNDASGTYKVEIEGDVKEFKNRQEALNYLKYTLEEQQEEAIVELLGLMTAEKLDNVKDGKLISLLKRLLKEMKQFVRSLLNQKEVEIDKLPDNMTLGDIADLLAYSNSKLILPGNEVIYTTPDNNKFKTYQEASNHISELAKNVKDVDLDKPIEKYAVYFSYMVRESDGGYDEQPQVEYFNSLKEAEEYSKRVPDGLFDRIEKIENFLPKSFIEKNKPYEQSKEIIEEWKKVNNIQYNPEEVYSRGQEFSSVVGAYSDFDVNLMMQNLLSHIEDNEKAGGKFAISAYTKPVDRKIGHLEGGGGKIKFKIYPQSEDILWASNIDVYSGSVWDASEKVNKDKKSELLGVSYTKYPSLRNVNTVQPNLAAIVDDLAHHHNELGIVLTGNNFRLEYDEDIPYTTKKIINSINSILDQKYGKLAKPEISKERAFKKITKEEFENAKSKGKVIKPSREKEGYGATEEVEYKGIKYVLQDSIIDSIYYYKSESIQPTQTNETLKESIDSVKEKLNENNLQDEDMPFTPKEQRKEYTSQALINTKIAALKEVAKKYPRSLIRSEVVKIQKGLPSGNWKEDMFEDELPFQKVSKETQDLFDKIMNTPSRVIDEKIKTCL